jgi:hypothetical protein
MKKRLDVWLVLGGMVIGLGVLATKAYSACTATCPAGYTQTAGSCPVVNHGCNASKCTGAITCSIVIGTSTVNTQVACSCQ